MIQYRRRRRYKYTLEADYVQPTALRPTQAVTTRFLDLASNGDLTIRKGYAWDGPSGPTIDTKTFMKGSLVHDALYQLMREGHIGPENRDHADQLLRDLCVGAGMFPVRARWVYWAVRLFGGKRVIAETRTAP